MIIFGTRGITTTRKRGQFHCPHCGPQRYCHKGVRRFVTVCFIPLIPMNTVGEYVECEACGNTYHMDVLHYDPAVAQEQMRSYLFETLKQVMVQVLLADERVDDNEVATVLNVFRQVSGEELSETELRVEIRAAEASPEATLEKLVNLGAMLDDRAKEMIVKAALLVASSDGAIDANERELIQHIAAAIEMSPAHMRGVIAELQEPRDAAPTNVRQAALFN